MTIAQAVPVALADGGLSSSVAVAAAALVVVLTIVLVFVMVLRSSSGSNRRTGTGLGYDAQMGPLGQPQNGMDDGSWGAQGGQQGGRGWAQDFGDEGQPGWGSPGVQGGAWGAGAQGAQGMQGNMGAMGNIGGASTMPQGGAWGAGAAADADQGGWNAQSRVAASSSRPMAPAAQGDWNAQAAGAPMPTPSRPNWGAPDAQAGSPWDQGAAAQGAPAWGPAQPTMPAGGPMQQPGGGWADQQMNGNWGGPPPGPSQPSGGWNGGVPSQGNGAWGGAPAAQRLGVLVVRQGKEPGKSFELRKERTTLGRSRESDIFLEDLAVSRLHTTISRDGSGRYLLRDEGSANGTYVNEQRVNEQMLEDGDVIQVGQTILIFNWR